MLAHALLAFLFPQPPQDDTIPQRVGCHTALNRQVLRNLSFYWHHSGFYNDSMDRLQIEIIIRTGLRLLEMTTTLKKKGEVILVWDILRPRS